MLRNRFYKFFWLCCFLFAFAVTTFGQGVYEAWVARYNGPGNADDNASALVVDTSGNVYVTGGSYGGGSSADYATIKYAANGDTLWVRRYDGPADTNDGALAMAVDDGGNIYVTGYSNGEGTSTDYATVKYLPDGSTAWVRRYNGTWNGADQPTDIAVDRIGNAYVTGFSQAGESNFNIVTMKYSPCSALPGDANASGDYSLADILSVVNYYFNKPGRSPQPLCWLSNLHCRGDWNASGDITLADIIQGVNYYFNKPGGPWDALPSGACCLTAP